MANLWLLFSLKRTCLKRKPIPTNQNIQKSHGFVVWVCVSRFSKHHMFALFSFAIHPHVSPVNKMVDNLRFFFFLDNYWLGFLYMFFYLSVCKNVYTCHWSQPLHVACILCRLSQLSLKVSRASRNHDIDFIAVDFPLVHLYPHHGCRSWRTQDPLCGIRMWRPGHAEVVHLPVARDSRQSRTVCRAVWSVQWLLKRHFLWAKQMVHPLLHRLCKPQARPRCHHSDT